MSEKIKAQSTVIVTKEYELDEIWEALTGSDFAGCQDFIVTMSCDWTKPWETFPVTHYNPRKLDKDGDYRVMTTQVTKEMLLEGFKKMVNSGMTHCGRYPLDDLEDHDACFAHALLQFTLYGEITFG